MATSGVAKWSIVFLAPWRNRKAVHENNMKSPASSNQSNATGARLAL
jgi:hypothetical protein